MKATQAVIEVLADSLAIKQKKIALLSGATSPNKRFLITDLSEEELRFRCRVVG